MTRFPVLRLPWSENPAPICDECGRYGLVIPASVEVRRDGFPAWYCAECNPYDDEISPRAGNDAEKQILGEMSGGV